MLPGASPLNLSIAPSPRLRPFVSAFWYASSAAGGMGAREHVLPTGQMHLVFRLHGPPLRILRAGGNAQGSTLCGPVIGGARMAFYVKDVGAAVTSVGAQLRPGAALALFGTSAAELAGSHNALADVWGGQADAALNRIADAGGPAEQLATFDRLLCERLDPVHSLHPQVALALAALQKELRIEEVVERGAYSHRALNVLFREATGLTPKRYARLQRFQKLLGMLKSLPALPLAELAYAAGYSDQAHMSREFRELAGVTPMAYRTLAPAAANHVPVGQTGQIYARPG